MNRTLEKLAAIATIIGVIVALFAWLKPFNPTGFSPIANTDQSNNTHTESRGTVSGAQPTTQSRLLITPTTNSIEKYQLRNIAFGKVATASITNSKNPPYLAIDGNDNTGWGTEDFPPAWLEIDLQGIFIVSSVELITAQSPDGETTHDLLVDDGSGTFQKIHTFKGFTSNHQKLTYSLDPPQSISKMKVVTVSSPSWVVWQEIRVIGHQK